MKILRISLASLLAIILTNCSESNGEMEASMLSNNEEVVYYPGDAHPDQGEFISQARAHEKLSAYLRYREQNLAQGRNLENVYGYFLGINKIKALIAMIEEENANLSGEDLLTGIRIYNALTTKELDGEMATYKDVFLVPAQKNLSDIVNLNDPKTDLRVSDEAPILNATFPCPQQCP